MSVHALASSIATYLPPAKADSSSTVIFPKPMSAGESKPLRGKARSPKSCLYKIIVQLKKVYRIVKRFFTSRTKKERISKVRFEESLATISKCHKVKIYKPKEDGNFRPLEVDAALFSSSKTLKRRHLLKEAEVAAIAASWGIPHVATLHIKGLGDLIPKRFERDGVIDNEILPTSHVRVAKEAQNHLANAFCLNIKGETRLIVRTGRIDSEQRVRDLAALLLNARKDLVDDERFELIVSSHQLNSYEIERYMIERQHRYVEWINRKLKGKVKIIHINTPTARFYEFSKSLNKVPVLGKSIDKVVLKNSEKKSRRQNLEAWGNYFNLLSPNAEIAERVEKINDLLIAEIAIDESLMQKKGKASDLQARMKKLKGKIRVERKQLKMALLEGYRELLVEKERLDSSSRVYRKIDLFTKILASQLNLPGLSLSRGHEQLLIQLFNLEMGISSAVNCRSGLDRTGYMHGLVVSLESAVRSLGEHRVHNMAMEWTALSQKLNKHAKDVDALVSRTSEEELVKLNDASEFRKTFLSNLIKIGLPITVMNTGFMGFKWQSGVYLNIAENRIPLNFLPPNISVNGKLVSLVKYDEKSGKARGLTKSGRKLLTKFSEMRGP